MKLRTYNGVQGDWPPFAFGLCFDFDHIGDRIGQDHVVECPTRFIVEKSDSLPTKLNIPSLVFVIDLL